MKTQLRIRGSGVIQGSSRRDGNCAAAAGIEGRGILRNQSATTHRGHTQADTGAREDQRAGAGLGQVRATAAKK